MKESVIMFDSCHAFVVGFQIGGEYCPIVKDKYENRFVKIGKTCTPFTDFMIGLSANMYKSVVVAITESKVQIPLFTGEELTNEYWNELRTWYILKNILT